MIQITFYRVPTDSGVCCAINAGQVLAKSRYSKLVLENQEDAGETKTVEIDAEGMTNGLRLVLDAFSVFLARPEDFPYVRKNSLKLSPEHEHFLSITGFSVNADDIKPLSIAARQCRFLEEGQLLLYSRYTAANCRLECLMR